MKDYFFCYTKRVSDYLQENGFKYITVAQDMKSKKVFSLYEITPSLKKTLSEYGK